MNYKHKTAILLTCITLMGCNNGGRNIVVGENTPVAEIFAAAEKEQARNRGTAAGDYYIEVERLYPYTPEAERALILAAQAYHDDGSLLESRIAAERYLQFFPGSPNAALAQYLVALSYYDGIVDITRDQERTFKALQELQKLMDGYPTSQYAELAKPKFELCLDQLAGKEMEIGRYYLARSEFVAAISRFKAVISEYPENRHKAEAYHRLVEAYLSLGLRGEAQKIFAQFGAYNASSEWYARSESLLKTGTQSNAGASPLRKIFLGTWQ